MARNRAGRLGELWGHSTHDRYGNHEVGTEQLWLTDQLGHQFLEVGAIAKWVEGRLDAE